MLSMVRKLWKDEEGATAVEYGLMVAAVAALIVIIAFNLGYSVSTSYNNVNNAINNPPPAP